MGSGISTETLSTITGIQYDESNSEVGSIDESKSSSSSEIDSSDESSSDEDFDDKISRIRNGRLQKELEKIKERHKRIKPSSESFYSILYNAYESFKNEEEFIFRPEDVWIDLCCQFSAHIKSDEEKYRKLVSWEGVKEVESSSIDDIPTIIQDLYSGADKLTDVGKYFVKTFSSGRYISVVHQQIMKLSMLMGMSNYMIYIYKSMENEEKVKFKVKVEGTREDWDEVLEWTRELVKLIDDEVSDAWYPNFKQTIIDLVKLDKIFLSLACTENPGIYDKKKVSGWLKYFSVFAKDDVRVESPVRHFVSIELKTPSGTVNIHGGIDSSCEPMVLVD